MALVIGTYASAVSFAASAATELAGVPYFELDALADPITGRGFKLLFRSGPLASACGVLSVDAVADLLAPALADRRRTPCKLAHAASRTGCPAARSRTAQMRRSVERGFAPPSEISYSATTMDFAPLVQRLRGAAIDVVLHTGHVNDVLLLHRAMKQAGWRPRMVVGTGGGYSLNDTAQALGADIEGVMNVDVTPYRISDRRRPGGRRGGGGVSAQVSARRRAQATA